MTGMWVLAVALAAAPAPVPAQKDRAGEADKEARKRAHEAAEEAEDRAEDTAEFLQKLAKRIEKGNEQRRKDTAEAIKDFNDRVEDYVKLHKKAADTLPKLTGDEDPVTVAAHRVALAHAIRARRGKSRRGEIFDAKVIPTIVARVRAELQGAEARPARKVIREGNPDFDPEGYVPVPVRINADYPLRAPVSTVPPSVLLVLPPLPSEILEYRFVGRDLILRDAEANMIVDYILGAAPPVPAPAR